jgi:hypothetical protein
MKVVMKHLLRTFVLLTFLFFPFYCSLESPTSNKSSRDSSQHNQVDSDPLPCCNNRYYGDICGNPFDPYAQVSFFCNGEEYTVKCDCCKTLWLTYGPDPYGYLNYTGTGCPDNWSLCPESI